MRSPLSLTCCALLAGALTSPAAVMYSITDLGGFHGTSSATQATDINESGIVVGGDFFAPNTTAFRWDGTLHPLPPLPTQSSSGASAINNLGLITGDSVTNGVPRAVIWQNDIPALLPVFGTRSNAWDINDLGDVVGTARVSNRDRAFLIEYGAAAAIDLGTLGGLEADAFAVNLAGFVVGGAETANRNTRAFRWSDLNGNNLSDPGEMVQLSDLGLSSAANTINNQNVAGGFVLRANFTRQAALWDANGQRIDLPNLPGATDAEVFALNSSLQAVGQSGAAVLWQNGTVQRLIDLIAADSGWSSLIFPYAIADSGQIVGWGRRGTSTNDRAFLLTPIPPVPEPGALLPIGALLLGATSRLRRR